MKDTIIILLIEILYLWGWNAHWLIWVLLLLITLFVGVAVWVAKSQDNEALKMITQMYEKAKDTKELK
jgi:c-di-AMP phosphodiesterase-like protein